MNAHMVFSIAGNRDSSSQAARRLDDLGRIHIGTIFDYEGLLEEARVYAVQDLIAGASGTAFLENLDKCVRANDRSKDTRSFSERMTIWSDRLVVIGPPRL